MPTPPLLQTAVPSRTALTSALFPRRVHRGDLWQLGDHRLLCGDGTRIEDVTRLMHSPAEDGKAMEQNRETADLLFTDPPYGVGYGNPARRAVRPVPLMAGDNLDEQGTYDLLRRALLLAPLRPGSAFYVCSPAGPNETLFRLALRDAGLPLRQSLVWAKQHFVLGLQDYQWKHESLLYGWKPGATHRWYGGRTQTTIWQHQRPIKSDSHPTMKPQSLVEQALRNSSQEGDLVYDGFGGSGTTLLACEATKRRCRMLEIEPHYGDVILARWEQATGKKAQRLTTKA